jgi:hypothetical protein
MINQRPFLWENDLYHKADYPVVGVSFYEAEAFANGRKKGCQQKRNGNLPQEEQPELIITLMVLQMAFASLGEMILIWAVWFMLTIFQDQEVPEMVMTLPRR